MQNTFISIQMCRAFAAFLVVLHHLELISHSLSPTGGLLPTTVHQFGYLGVDVFFVISGFIMSHVTSGPVSVGKFAWGRIVRILPSYWVMSAIWVVLVVASGNRTYTAEYLLKSFILFPQCELPALGPGWTLEHEAIFYLIVAVFIALNNLRFLPIFVLALGFVGVIVHHVLPANGYGEFWDLHIFSPYNLNFGAGIVIHRCRDRMPSGVGPILVPLGICLLVASGLLTNAAYGWGHVETQPIGFQGFVRLITGLLASTVLIAGCVAMERHRPELFKRAPVLRSIGDSSYALYLIHTIAFAALSVVFDRLLPHTVMVTWIACTVSIVAVLISAHVWFLVAEKRVTRALQFKRQAQAQA